MNSRSAEDLGRSLAQIDGRGYRAYQDIRGVWSIGRFEIEIAHVQPDPFAPPSLVRARIGCAAAGFPELPDLVRSRRVGCEDFLGRALSDRIRATDAPEIAIDRYGQEILPRTAVQLRDRAIEARLTIRLPAAGRRITGRRAQLLFLDVLPRVLGAALSRELLDENALLAHQDAVEDHEALTASLSRNEWVAFVADGAILPRRAGHDERPLVAGDTPVVSFCSPDSLAAVLRLPHAGEVRGMAIPRGVTLLVGGGFHGKSTLLDAIAVGIYPHIPGDGRERVAADSATVKIRAEDGRAVSATDISAFIGELPFGRATCPFSTQNASGSTSQAASIIEALEAGARVLLLDEDSSATNFMIRDEPMRRLVRSAQEPITPFLDRVQSLARNRGVSSVLVVGGSGEYFRVADLVIQMDRYLPVDVTQRAREIVPRAAEIEFSAWPERERRISLQHYRTHDPRGPRVRAHGMRRVVISREEIDLGACEQLVSVSQAHALAEILARLIEGGPDGVWSRLASGFTASELRSEMDVIEGELLDRASRFPRGDLAGVRAFEVVAMVNRLRDLVVA